MVEETREIDRGNYAPQTAREREELGDTELPKRVWVWEILDPREIMDTMDTPRWN